MVIVIISSTFNFINMNLDEAKPNKRKPDYTTEDGMSVYYTDGVNPIYVNPNTGTVSYQGNQGGIVLPELVVKSKKGKIEENYKKTNAYRLSQIDRPLEQVYPEFYLISGLTGAGRNLIKSTTDDVASGTKSIYDGVKYLNKNGLDEYAKRKLIEKGKKVLYTGIGSIGGGVLGNELGKSIGKSIDNKLPYDKHIAENILSAITGTVGTTIGSIYGLSLADPLYRKSFQWLANDLLKGSGDVLFYPKQVINQLRTGQIGITKKGKEKAFDMYDEKVARYKDIAKRLNEPYINKQKAQGYTSKSQYADVEPDIVYMDRATQARMDDSRGWYSPYKNTITIPTRDTPNSILYVDENELKGLINHEYRHYVQNVYPYKGKKPSLYDSNVGYFVNDASHPDYNFINSFTKNVHEKDAWYKNFDEIDAEIYNMMSKGHLPLSKETINFISNTFSMSKANAKEFIEEYIKRGL